MDIRQACMTQGNRSFQISGIARRGGGRLATVPSKVITYHQKVVLFPQKRALIPQNTSFNHIFSPIVIIYSNKWSFTHLYCQISSNPLE